MLGRRKVGQWQAHRLVQIQGLCRLSVQAIISAYHLLSIGTISANVASARVYAAVQTMPGLLELCTFLDQQGLPRGLITRNVLRRYAQLQPGSGLWGVPSAQLSAWSLLEATAAQQLMALLLALVTAMVVADSKLNRFHQLCLCSSTHVAVCRSSMATALHVADALCVSCTVCVLQCSVLP